MSTDRPPLLSLRGLHKDRRQGRGDVYRLEVPALELAAGERLLLQGPSGCGKSTLLDMIALILRPDAAEGFRFLGENPFDPKGNAEAAGARLRRRIGYVLQTGGLLPFVGVRENILLARRLAGLPTAGYAEDLAGRMGIEKLIHKLPGRLSVGERQRAAIAAALAGEPALVLADEPTAALDPKNAAIVLDLLIQTVDTAGAALILVTHAPERVPAGFRAFSVVPAGREGVVDRAVVREEAR